MSREGEDDHLSESSGSEDEKEDPSIDKLCAIVVFDEEMTPTKHVELIQCTWAALKDRHPPALTFQFKKDYGGRHPSEIPETKRIMRDSVDAGMMGCLLKLGYKTEASQMYACAFLKPQYVDEGLKFIFPTDEIVLRTMVASLRAFDVIKSA